MMLLADQLSLLVAAPNGIRMLRDLILELAVRGKLVPHDFTDTSASRLLDESRRARRIAMSTGLGKKEKPAAPVELEDQLFKLPANWVWCRVVDTGDYINGLAFSARNWSESGRPIIRIQNLSGRSSQFNRTRADVDESVVVRDGDILVSWSATLDAFVWRGEEGVLNQHIFRVEPSNIVARPFLYWVLKWVIRELAASDHSHGLVMAHINRGPFLAQPVALPPIEEQHRIAGKVEELMALCDAWEVKERGVQVLGEELAQLLSAALLKRAFGGLHTKEG